MSKEIGVVVATYGEQHWSDLAISRAVPSALEQVDWNVLSIHEKEGTRASSLNHGAEQSRGEWLIFLDADDELAPGYVGAMRRALEQHNSAGTRVLFTPAVQWIRKGRPAAPAFQRQIPLKHGNWLVIGTMISKTLFNEIGGFHEHPHGLEDWNLWARAYRAGAKIRKVRDAVYRAHVNPQSEHHKLFRDKERFGPAYEAARLDAWG